jgi:hypothetical protein
MALTALAIDIAHRLVDAKYLNDEGRIHFLDHMCSGLRYRWAQAGKPTVDCMLDSQAFRTVANRTIAALELQRHRK